MPNIAIIWDFDNTLTPEDSTSKVIDIISGKDHKEFWNFIKSITGKKRAPEWEALLGSDAPAWMYSLSRIAHQKGIPLNAEFFKEFVLPEIKLYPNVIKFLSRIKKLEQRTDFKKQNIKIHHFIVSAGLQELVEQVFPTGLISHTFGCRYQVIVPKGREDEPESIPVFCMDETMKTRSLFEISKGSFVNPEKGVNKRVEKPERWALFSDFIYIGDGPTDIPALSLTRHHGGLGIVVYDKKTSKAKRNKRLESMALDKRADFITEANYALKGDLLKYLEARCIQIKQKYEAETFV